MFLIWSVISCRKQQEVLHLQVPRWASISRCTGLETSFMQSQRNVEWIPVLWTLRGYGTIKRDSRWCMATITTAPMKPIMLQLEGFWKKWVVLSFFVNRNPFIVNIRVYVIATCDSRYHHLHVTDIPISCGVSLLNIRIIWNSLLYQNSNELKIIQEL